MCVRAPEKVESRLTVFVDQEVFSSDGIACAFAAGPGH